MSSWLIDENGFAWPEGDYQTARQFGLLRHGKYSSEFLIKKTLVDGAGCVRASQRGRMLIAEFCRERVDAYALIGLMRLIAEKQPDGVAFLLSGSQQHALIYRSQQSWLSYLGALITFQKSADIRLKRTVPLEQSPFHSRLAAGEEVVRSVSDPVARDRILERLSQGRFALARLDTSTGNTTVMGVGSVTLAKDPRNMKGIVGRSVSGIYDPSYGAWIARHFLAITKGGVPVAEDVDATIKIEGKPPELESYSRLTTPVALASGEHWVLSMSKLRLG